MDSSILTDGSLSLVPGKTRFDQALRSVGPSKSNRRISLVSCFGFGCEFDFGSGLAWGTERKPAEYSTCPARALALSASTRSVRMRWLLGSKSTNPSSVIWAMSSVSAGGDTLKLSDLCFSFSTPSMRALATPLSTEITVAFSACSTMVVL